MIYTVNENSKHMAHETEDLFQRLLNFLFRVYQSKALETKQR